MAQESRITGITNSNAAAVAGKAGRKTNLLSIKLVNTSAAPVTVDLKDGNTVFDTLELGPNGQTWHEWAKDNKNEIGRLLTASNDFNVAARAASGSVEATTHFGRR